MCDVHNLPISVSGSCSDDQTGLVLSDGRVTTDPDVYLKGWALGECVQHREVQSCAAGVAKGCDVLRSEVFSHCHALVPLQDYEQICRTVACQPNAVCDLVTAYSSVCRQQGVCVDWRTPTLCRESSVINESWSDAARTLRVSLISVPEKEQTGVTTDLCAVMKVEAYIIQHTVAAIKE